jgi:CheY-like chemotaxis protein
MHAEPRRLLSILVVDDDDADAMMIEEALELSDATVQVSRVGDGREALDYLRRTGGNPDAQRPDLILLDLNMPRMDGHQALVAIKADDELKSIPVVILTTSGASSDVLSSYQHQANAYVTKPMELAGFETAVGQISRFYRDVALLPPT